MRTENQATEFIKMPGGEVRTVVPEPPKNITHTTIEMRGSIVTSDRLFHVANAVDAIRAYGIQDIRLDMPYFPGARQDRRDAPGVGLSVKVYTNFINSLGFSKVTICDPHSDVVTALLDNVEVRDHKSLLGPVINKPGRGPNIVFFPDSGAEKKYGQQYAGMPCSSAKKKRDPENGKLSGFTIDPDFEGNAAYIWIVDDICDGGRTFIELAKLLNQQNPDSEFCLAVTHGIFSNGIEELKRWFSRIVTTNSVYDGRFGDLVEIVTI